MIGADLHLSFEFFPPNTPDGWSKLLSTARRLQDEKPDFFSVTYGAGGSTKSRTLQTVKGLRAEGFNVNPHLSWGGVSRGEITQTLHKFLDLGVEGMVVLRGDSPSGSVPSVMHNASELVQLIRHEIGSDLQIFVAAYPEMHPDAQTPSQDLQFLHEKVRAGANACITQYFYNADAYLHFVDRCRSFGILVPIIPGIMPIYNYDQLVRFSQNCGAEIPRWIERGMHEYRTDKKALEEFGIVVVTQLCERLRREGAPGFHFYSLNRALIPRQILRNLALQRKPSEVHQNLRPDPGMSR